ncbi:MAG: hypothetical protein WA629_15360 [Candidatus Aquilonibacter sp.]
MIPATPAPSPTPQPPCVTPIAVTLADRPGTGSATSTGGAPCVVPLGELVIESGVRRELTWEPDYSVLSSGPLTLLRYGIAPRLEFAIAPPSNQSLFVPAYPLDNGRGPNDPALDLKYGLLDQPVTQASVDVTYVPPTGSGAFTNGAPTYSISGNLAIAINDRWSFAMSQAVGTNVGANAAGLNVTYFDYTPSYTFAYAITNATSFLVQVALESRQSPEQPSGNRSYLALQQTIGSRLAIDLDFERNLKPAPGLGPQQALGFGFVWIAAPAR